MGDRRVRVARISGHGVAAQGSCYSQGSGRGRLRRGEERAALRGEGQAWEHGKTRLRGFAGVEVGKELLG